MNYIRGAGGKAHFKERCASLLMKLLLFAVLVFFGFSGANFARAESDKNDQLSNRIEAVEREIAVAKITNERAFESNDKRLSDFATLATMQGSHTTWVGNVVAMFSVLITILVFGAGFATYITSRNRAIIEARDAAEKWFARNAVDLSSRLSALEEQARNALREIDKHKSKVEDGAQEVQRAFEKKLEEVGNAIERKQNVLEEQTESLFEEGKEARSLQPKDSSISSNNSDKTTAESLFVEANELEDAGDFAGALDAYDKAINISGDSSEFDKAKYRASKGLFFLNRQRYQEAISEFDEVIEIFGDSLDPGVQVQVAFAMLTKTSALEKLERHDEEIELYRQLSDFIEGKNVQALRVIEITLLIRRAMAARKLGDHNSQLEYLNQILVKFGDDTDEYIAVPAARALTLRARVLSEMNRYNDALETYGQIIAKYDRSGSGDLAEVVAQALMGQASVYKSMASVEKEIESFDEIIEKFSGSDVEKLRDYATDAFLYKGLALARNKRFADEIKVYDELDRRFSSHSTMSIRSKVAEGLYQKARSLSVLDRTELALATFEEVDRRFGADENSSTRLVVAKSIVGKIESLLRDKHVNMARLAHRDFNLRYANDSSVEIAKLKEKLSNLQARD